MYPCLKLLFWDLTFEIMNNISIPYDSPMICFKDKTLLFPHIEQLASGHPTVSDGGLVVLHMFIIVLSSQAH